LQKEKTATQLALMQTQLGKARTIVALREADSHRRAEAILRAVVSRNPPEDIRGEARDAAVAAFALPSARAEPLLGARWIPQRITRRSRLFRTK
jgi:hypothetical protein